MGPLLSHAAGSCGEPPSAVCDWVHDRTGNGVLAGIADWFIGRPLTIVAIVVVAWAITRLARRFVRRTMRRIAESEGLASLAALGPRLRSAAASSTRSGSGEVPGGGNADGSRDAVLVREPRRVARANSIAGVASSSISVVIWAIASVMVIGQLGVDLAPLIAGAGIAGIAIGFGAQSLVRDCLAGFFSVVEDQYGLGDIVDLGSASGVVERFTLRTTVLRGQDGTLWHVPNGEVRRVGNLSHLWSVAVVDVVVPNDRPLDAAKAAVMAAATATCSDPQFAPTVLEAPQLLGVEQLATENVTLRLLAKTRPGDQFALQRALREAIKQQLDELGGTIPAGGTTWSQAAGAPPAEPPPDS